MAYACICACARARVMSVGGTDHSGILMHDTADEEQSFLVVRLMRFCGKLLTNSCLLCRMRGKREAHVEWARRAQGDV